MFHVPVREKPTVSWLFVILWTILIYLTIPLARTLQAFVVQHADRMAFAWGVAVSALIGLAWAIVFVARNGTRVRGVQYFWLIGVTTLYLWGVYYLRSAPEEALHFVQYGVLSLLVFRALTHHGRDAAVFFSAAAICGILGAVDEMIQWVTPRRFFDFRDVTINFIGGALMQVAIAFGIRPALIRGKPVSPASMRICMRSYILFLFLLGLCASNTPQRVHWYADRLPVLEFLKTNESVMAEYGYRHQDPDIGTFSSRLNITELHREDDIHARDYARILDTYYDPETYADFLVTLNPAVNPFVHEARVRLFRRDRYRDRALRSAENSAQRSSHFTVAYREHRILERYYGQTYRLSRFYPVEKEIAVMRDGQNSDKSYVSPVSANVFTLFREREIWLMLLVAIIGLEATQRWYARRMCG